MKLGHLVLGLSILLGAEAQAQTTPAAPSEIQAARQAVRKACSADVQSMCADKRGRETTACLREHNKEISTGCREAMSKLPPPRRPSTRSPPSESPSPGKPQA